MTALAWLGDGVAAIVLILCFPVAILVIGLPFALLVQLIIAVADKL